VFVSQVLGVLVKVVFSESDEVKGILDLLVDTFEFLGLLGDLLLHAGDVILLVFHIFLIGSLVGLLLGGEVSEGFNEVGSDVVHEVTNLTDGVVVGEFGGRETDEGLDEGGLNGVLELLLDLGKGVLGLLDLDEGSISTGLDG